MDQHIRNSELATRIVHTAAQLFARQGYCATSTREIARVADIRENTLFRQFNRKEDLFWAALRSRLSGVKLRREVIEGMSQGAPPDIIVPQIVAQLVDTAIITPELPRLIAVGLSS